MKHYVTKGNKRLCCGFTTGSCAALAAKAATEYLLSGENPQSVSIMTPKGLSISVPVRIAKYNPRQSATCSVQKDAGDDPDITNGIMIYATAEKCGGNSVIINGGKGIGRITKHGLEQPVGAAAINSVPHQMICKEVQQVCRLHDYSGGISILIEAPEGEEIAKKTFNPHLGIEGGISIIGTSGIVEPMSLQALLDSIEVEMRMLAANSERKIIISPGNYSRDFISKYPSLSGIPNIKCSNFIGDTLDFAAAYGFEEVLLIGHIGKLIKLAGGIMDTHSRTADCRMELLALYSALSGLDGQALEKILEAPTVDEGIELLENWGLKDTVLKKLMEKIMFYIGRRVGRAFKIGVIAFSNKYGILAADTHNINIAKGTELNA